jgi:uncharacterized protein
MTLQQITADDVPALCEGSKFYCSAVGEAGMATVLAWTIDLLKRNGPVTLIHPNAIAPETRCAATCVIGSGIALADLPPSGDEFPMALRELEHLTRHRLDAVCALAAATVSALVPLAAASALDLPLLDADGEGRAFALIHHTSMHLAGQNPAPLVLRGATGESVSFNVPDGGRIDTLLRSNVDSLGGWAALAGYPGTVADVRRGALIGTMSRLLHVGRVLQELTDPDVLVARLAAVTGCRRIGRGRIVELEHLSRPGDVAVPTHPSTVVIDEVGGQARLLRLELRSEIVAVFADGALAAAVPDLICLVDVLRGELSTLDSLEPGDLVDVLVTPAEDVWYTAEALAMVGPASHGIPLEHPRHR